MLPNPAEKVAVFVELIMSTPSTPNKASVSNKAMCTCLATDWSKQHNISCSNRTKGHTRHPEITHTADPLGSSQAPTGKLRFDRSKQPPSTGPDNSWCTATRLDTG